MDYSLKHKPEFIRALEECIGEKLLINSLGSFWFFFFDMRPKAQTTKAKVNKWTYIKPKRFCTAKEIISEMKGQPS